MHHLFWIVLHIGAYLLIPDFGASISLLIYLIYELSKNYLNKNRLQFIHLYFLGLVVTVIANMSVILEFRYGKGLGSFIYALPEFFPAASLVFALGNQFLAMGYFYNTKISLPKIDYKITLTYTVLKNIFWLSLLFSFNKFWLFFTLPGTFQTLLELLPLVGIFILGRYAGKFENKTLFTQALVLALATAFNALLFSYLRMEILLPILVFVLSYYIGSGNLKSFFSVKFVPVIILMLLFYSFFEVFGAKRGDISSGIDRLTQLNLAIEEDRKWGLDEEESLSAFERSSNIAQISAAVGLVSKNGHYQGKASTPLVVAFIPRFLWPEKPVIALGVWYAVEIGAAVQVDDWYNNAINMTIPGQLFLDFGWIGLALGSLLVGIFLRMLWDSVNFYQKRFNLLGTFFGVYLLFTGFLGIGADLQILITYLAMYLVMLFLSKTLKRNHENSLRRTSLARK